MSEYIPVTCELHSEYELAVMRHQFFNVSWKDRDKQVRKSVLKPLDLLTRDKEEIMLAEDKEGQLLELRLDYILTIEDLDQ